MIVCKFGGTSVQDAEAMERVAGIISRRLKDTPVVVASAMGKTTNRLLEAAKTAAHGKRQEALDILASLKDKHLGEAQKLGLKVGPSDDVGEVIHSHFREMGNIVKGLSILGELTPRSMDAIASFGERLATVILAHAFSIRGIPA